MTPTLLADRQRSGKREAHELEETKKEGWMDE